MVLAFLEWPLERVSGWDDFSGTWLLTALGKMLRNCYRIPQPSVPPKAP